MELSRKVFISERQGIEKEEKNQIQIVIGSIDEVELQGFYFITIGSTELPFLCANSNPIRDIVMKAFFKSSG